MKTLIWLRRDLRVQDNPALARALSVGQPVEAVYVLSDDAYWAAGSASNWYLHHSLLALQKDLAAINIPLKCLTGSSFQVLPAYAEAHAATAIYWNRVVEPQMEMLDSQLKHALQRMKIDHRVCDDDCLLMPEHGYKKDGTPYRVFTPFWKVIQDRLETADYQSRLHAAPEPDAKACDFDESEIIKLALLDDYPWHGKLHQYWTPGEASSQKRLLDFIDEQLAGYEFKRDYPALCNTSRLSAALHFGEISVVRIYALCQQILLHEPDELTRQGITRFLAEIGWREFARHVLHAFPDTPNRSLNSRFDQQAFWRSEKSDEFLHRWQQGETGFPLIDAGMRELWQSGTMHNRVRMLVASFLTKNLGIHWLEGAHWFWDTLVDADLASNTLGWQWVAGCGTDAAPYYRIFNPQTQTVKFDTEYQYINRWLGKRDARPAMVDLKTSRMDALMRYQTIIRNGHDQVNV